MIVVRVIVGVLAVAGVGVVLASVLLTVVPRAWRASPSSL